MSHYLHHLIEYKDGNDWKLLKVLAKPGNYMTDEHKDKIFKVGEEDYYWESEFVTSYLSLRDNYFGSHPWADEDKFNRGVPTDATEESKEILKEWVDGHFVIYNCTVADIEDTAEKVFNKWREKVKHEDIMNFAADFARRLGYAKEDGYYEVDREEEEMTEEKLIIYYQFIELAASVKSLVESIENSYWFDKEKIRILIWTD